MQNYVNAETHRAVGDFIIEFAMLEQQLNTFLAIDKDPKNNSFNLSPFYTVSFAQKLKTLSNSINKIKMANREKLQEDWQKYRERLEEINIDRQHIVHGSGHANKFPLIDLFTFSDENWTKTVKKKVFPVHSLMDLTNEIRKISKQIFDSHAGGFLYRFMKAHNPNYKEGSLVTYIA